MDSLEKYKVNKGKISKFLAASMLLVIITLIGTLTFYVVRMKDASRKVLNEVGTIYMQSMSDKISTHFETTVSLRMDPLNTIIANNPPSVFNGSEEQMERLRYEGTIRDYDYLAFLDSNGRFKMIYGDQVVLEDPEPFMESILDGRKKVAVGHSIKDNKIVMMGVPAQYRIEGTEASVALVAGIPTTYINDILSLDVTEDELTYSHIIRRNGTFVIRNANTVDVDYFEMLRKTITDDDDSISADEIIQQLTAAMESNRDYSCVTSVNHERRHLYCTLLGHSEWYLITIMPYGVLDTAIESLDHTRVVMFLICVAIITAVLCAVFVMYFTMTRKQIKLLDETREAAKRESKAKSEFLSNMSHDIRTPMNAIVGMTAIAQTHINDPEQLENCLSKIALSSKHLLGLINDILDMSKIESGKMTLTMSNVSLREVMDAIVSIVQPQIRAKRQKFDVFIDKIEYEQVYCDSLRLNQVLLNLLSNAIKFTPNEGCIELHLSEEASERSENYIRVHISVQDNGIGMSEEFQKDVFEKFMREDSKRVHKTEGTGLGMAITKYIVDAMEGTIVLQSELGKGTRFDVTLDLEKADVPVEEMILPQWHMLVVDDDEMICTSATDALKRIGIDAEWTLDGESAVKMAVEAAKSPAPYQIILLDWKLPGIDGIETAREIRRALGSDIPILLVSAYDWSAIESEATAAGITGFISKPLFRSTLYYGLKKFVAPDDIDPAGQAFDAENQVSSPSAKPADEKPESDVKSMYNFNGTRILLAEDNDLNWEIASELLSEFGLEIDRAENGQMCCEMLNNSEPGTYKAILMDIRMPIMSGYEASEAIRRSDRPDRDIPIIAMTADAFSDDVKRCIDAGMNAHTSKPIDVDAVVKLLWKYINEK